MCNNWEKQCCPKHHIEGEIDLKTGNRKIVSLTIVVAVLTIFVLGVSSIYIKYLNQHYRVEVENGYVEELKNDDRVSKIYLDEDGNVVGTYRIPAIKDNKVAGVFLSFDASFDIEDSIIITREEINAETNRTIFRFKMMVAVFLGVYAITIIIIFIMQRKNDIKMEQIAYVDEITGGKSFEKFKLEADKLIKETDNNYVLVDLDIDKFKYINDIFGYEEGNVVIRFIWKLIDDMIEEEETFAHHRADQFVLLLKLDDMDRVIERIEKLADDANKKKNIYEKNYEIDLSIGIYPIDKRYYQIDTAIGRARLTKKSIKGQHSKIYAIYDEELRQKVLQDQEVENLMEKSLENQEFKVYYQPKFASDTCEPVGAEALVRWYNDEIGMIYPSEFIHVFESNGFIADLDKYMFEHVCMDIRKWLDEGCTVVPVSVNLSQQQLYNKRFIEEYKEILNKYDISAEYVQLELTETTLFSEANILDEIIDELHSIGFKILMDDFGTGYSSLNMLKNVDVDILKLDKSFVDDIGDPKGDIIVSTIVSLGQLFNMKIVAEGVETKEQYEFLRDIFCDEIQGYYFSKPISSEEYREKMVKIQ